MEAKVHLVEVHLHQPGGNRHRPGTSRFISRASTSPLSFTGERGESVAPHLSTSRRPTAAAASPVCPTSLPAPPSPERGDLGDPRPRCARLTGQVAGTGGLGSFFSAGAGALLPRCRHSRRPSALRPGRKRHTPTPLRGWENFPGKYLGRGHSSGKSGKASEWKTPGGAPLLYVDSTL